jgi:medium-chain acyl-[acyl-carrier-protein] hydrolase
MTNSLTTTPARWLPYSRRLSPTARLRLFCLPYAGGSATVYRAWLDALPAGVEVCPVELPGRGARITERPFDRLAPLADAVAQALRPHLDRPFAIFGHSMGAVLGFELARRLRAREGLVPRALFMSGRSAPQIRWTGTHAHLLGEAELIEHLRTLNGTPPAVLEHPELLELVLPLLRADFAVSETYEHAPDDPFDVPLIVFGGDGDPEVARAELDAWREHTRGPFRVHVFAGDHFFLQARQVELLATLGAELRALL